MSQTVLERVAEEIQRLSPEERQRLRALLDTPPTGQTPPTEDEFEQELVASGFLWSAPPLDVSAEPEERKLITIKGRPLSETIIEERR